MLADVTPRHEGRAEETFGPVAPLFRFEGEDEAVAMANDTEFGLASYFYSRDIGPIWRVSEGLDVRHGRGELGHPFGRGGPFGGVKESGIGREGSYQGLDEFLETKYLCMGASRAEALRP